MKHLHWFEITLITILMTIHLYAAFSAPHNFSMRWFTRDDAYYYFKVAQNITEGQGSTFDGINTTNGYHPLWMLICIPIFALARFDLILPLRILLVVMAAISALSCILLFRLLRKIIPEPVAIFTTSLLGFSLIIHNTVVQPGMETGITLLAIILMLYLLQKFDEKWRTGTIMRRDVAILALAACFVLFSRLDSVYLALLAGVWIIFRRTPIRYFLPIDLLATFAIIVFAYIQRAEIKIYILVFAESAIIAACVAFAIQTVAFYYVGFYQHPKGKSILSIIQQALIAVTITALALAVVLWILPSITGPVSQPRAIPLIYWIIAFPVAVLTRLTVRAISPWPASPPNEMESPLSQFRQNWKTWFGDSLTYYGILGGALGAYMLFNRWAFGTFMPVSGQIKRWWGSLPNNVYGGGSQTMLDVFAMDPRSSQAWALFTRPIREWVSEIPKRFGSFDTLYWTTILIIGLIGLFLFLRNRPKNLNRLFQTSLIPLLISAELQAFLYGAMGYAAEHEWYWMMQMVSLLILTALLLGNLVEMLPRKKIVARLVWMGAGAASLYLAYTFTITIYHKMPYQDRWAGQPHMDMLPILEGYTEPGAIIGMTGGGNAGYFITDRTIVNMDGLINSYAYFQAVKAETADEYLQEIGLDYVFGSHYILTESMPYRPNMTNRLQKIPGVPAYGNKELMHFIPDPPQGP